MDFAGYIVGLSRDFKTNRKQITLSIDDDINLHTVEEKFDQDTKVSVHIGKYSKSRSLNANAYLWALCGGLAEKLHTTKEEIYLDKLFKHPVFEYDEEGHGIFALLDEKKDPNKYALADETVHHYWLPIPKSRVMTEQGWYMTHAMIRGSSLFTVKEMSILLEDVIEEARSKGVRTETDENYQAMLESWGRKHEKA